MSMFILASASPRRSDILNQIGIEFKVIESNADEEISDKCPPEKYVEILAERKAEAVFNNISKSEDEVVVIGADTIVVYGHEILGKPKDKKDAFNTLRKLQGNKHSVYTGISVFYKSDNGVVKKTNSDKTDVYMLPLTDGEILNYIESEEPLDKAGSYAVQGKGAVIIEKIDGDFYTVVGMSPSKLYKMLSSIGVKIKFQNDDK